MCNKCRGHTTMIIIIIISYIEFKYKNETIHMSI